MTSITDLGAQAWRDFNTDGVPSSGARHTPKSDARAVMAALDTQKAEAVEDLAALKVLTSRPASALTAGEASAYDGLGDAYAWDEGATDTANEPFIVTPTSGPAGRYKMLSPFVQNGTGAVMRRMRDKLREVELSVEDFWLAIDADDTNAINRAIAAVPADGGTVIFNRNLGDVYNISAALSVQRGNISLRGKHGGIVTINSTSTTANHMTIGAVGAAYLFNIHLSDLVFTRTGVCSAGWAIDAANIGHASFGDIRVYGDNKQYQGLRFRSCSNLRISGIRTENCLKESGYFGGLGTGPATMDGMVIDVIIEDWRNAGGHASSASLATQGILILDDFVGGVWIQKYTCDSHKGYALYLKGTLANRASNTLIKVNQLDVESGAVGAGAFKVDAYTGVWVDAEWVSGKDLDTVHVGTNAQNIFWNRGDIAIAYSATEAAAFYCDGQVVHCGAQMVGYSTNAHGTGIQIGANADRVFFLGGGVNQMAVGLDVHASSRTGKTIVLRGVEFNGNASVASFDLTAVAHDLHIDCEGLAKMLRGDMYLGGSPLSAPLHIVGDPLNVNGINLYGGQSGAPPNMAVVGAGTNIGYFETMKGTGNRGFKSQAGAATNMELLGADPGSGTTVIYVRYHNGVSVTYQNVSLGAADSGGAGFKVLRVPN